MKLLPAFLLIPALALSQSQQPVKDRPHEPPTVRLLGPGAAPLKPLRYQLDRPQELTVTAWGDWKMTAPAASSDSTFPVMKTPLRLTPHNVGVEFLWLSPSFTGPPPGSGLERVTRTMLDGLERSGGVFATDARGVISKFALRPGPNDTALDAGTMQKRSLYALQMGRGMIALLDVPLPEEPVGVGARWQVERIAVRGTLSFVQVTTFTLEKREGSLLQLSYRFGGKWDPGSGLLESELKLGVSGGGKATVDLTRPLPIALEDELSIDARMQGRDGAAATHSGVVRSRVELN